MAPAALFPPRRSGLLFARMVSVVGATIPPPTSLGGLMRRTAAAVALLVLALAGCSSGGDPAPAATKTVTATPALSEAQARAACVDAWRGWFEEAPDDYDPDTDPLPELAACEGRADSAALGFEALRERNAAARESLDACLEDPACTDWPLPTP